MPRAISSPASPALTPDTAGKVARGSPAGLAYIASRGRWLPARHLLAIDEQLCRVERGEIDRLMIFQPPRSGKPVYDGTMILMGDGTRKTLAEVKVGEEVIGHSRQRRRVLAVHEQGELPAVTLTTFSGREVTTALDHPFLTADGWVNAGDLAVGHVLALLPEAEAGRELPRPDEEFRLAGYFVGDGNLAPRPDGTFPANITCFDPIEAEDIHACAKTMGFVVNEAPTGRFKFSGHGWRDPNGPRPWLREIGLASKTSWTKRVPAFVFEASPRQIAQFLGAYFACDGTLTERRTRTGERRDDFTGEFYSVSAGLLADVRHLLLRLGVRSRLRRKDSRSRKRSVLYTSWRLTITSRDDAAKFVARIPMVSVKAVRLADWRTHRVAFDAPFIPDPVVAVQVAGEVPCRCLTVETDETFTVEDLVVHNSMLTSEFTPAWYLGRHPDRRVILCSYGAHLASNWGRKARDVLAAYGPQFFDVQVATQSKAADHWNISGEPGGMNTAGVGGPITGFGADLLIIDDPLKDAEEAGSEVIRAKQIDWWQAVARTRLMAGGAVVLMQTRWHEEDLAGWLLEDAVHGGDQWEVLSLPAIAEEDDQLGRGEGEALWPAKFPLKDLERTKRALGGYYWAALYQQRPVPAGGALFKRHDFRYFSEDPEHELYIMHGAGGEPDKTVGRSYCYRMVTVDPAFSEKQTADYTALGLWAVTPWMDLLLLEVARIRFDIENLAAAIQRYWELWQPNDMRIEAKAYGAKVISQLVTKGLAIVPLEADTDKVTRALSAVPRYEAHTVYHRKGGEYVHDYEREILHFPSGAHDDQVDMFAYAALALPELALHAIRQQSAGVTQTGGLMDQPL